MRTIKLTISYDGTNYCGWQIQPKGRSVQGVIQSAVRKITGERNNLIGASRTDAGVHALGQTAHFQTATRIPTRAFVKGVNAIIDEDISIVSAPDVKDGFHAQKDARSKIYSYFISVSQERMPLCRNRCWQLREPLDIAAMKRGAKYLVGKHDFKSFQSTGSSATDAVRLLKKITIKSNHPLCKILLPGVCHPCENRDPVLDSRFRGNDGQGQKLIAITIEGDGFVYKMVRNIVGLLVSVGQGRYTPEFVKEHLEKKSKKKAGVCAPACGLYLVKVKY